MELTDSDKQRDNGRQTATDEQKESYKHKYTGNKTHTRAELHNDIVIN